MSGGGRGGRPCPGCGGGGVLARYRVPSQPVVLNYRFATAAEAAAVARADIDLAECADCGLVANRTFDPALVPYDGRYENSQCHSPTFARYLAEQAGELVRRHGLAGARVLEVGCGKGDFLVELQRAGAAGGEGYDTSYVGPETAAGGAVRFHTRYLAAADVVGGGYGAVVCRHVVEHVPAVGAFLGELRAIAAAAGDPAVVVETPRFEWIAENGCFWDVFYEHANYFTMPALAGLCRAAGFAVTGHRPTFGDQYQVVELRVGGEDGGAAHPAGPVAGPGFLAAFSREAEARVGSLEDELRAAVTRGDDGGGGGRGYAIWGAGAKGVCLANRLGLRPRFVVDVNAAKQGCAIPGTAIPVLAPEAAPWGEVAAVLVANPAYRDEIAAWLTGAGVGVSLVVGGR